MEKDFWKSITQEQRQRYWQRYEQMLEELWALEITGATPREQAESVAVDIGLVLLNPTYPGVLAAKQYAQIYRRMGEPSKFISSIGSFIEKEHISIIRLQQGLPVKRQHVAFPTGLQVTARTRLFYRGKKELEDFYCFALTRPPQEGEKKYRLSVPSYTVKV